MILASEEVALAKMIKIINKKNVDDGGQFLAILMPFHFLRFSSQRRS
jgi:hypothetical protein